MNTIVLNIPSLNHMLPHNKNILESLMVQAKTACVLIDLCSGVLEPWMPQVISKIDLAMELLEDLLGVVQGGQHPSIHARSAILYVILALSGYMDDLMAKFKEVKHSILFLMEMLERFLQPVLSHSQPVIDLRVASDLFLMSEEHTCAVALNVIRAAVRKPSTLSYLELEWRRGSVPPSVILSVLDPHMQLPAGIDFCKCPVTSSEELTSIDSFVGVSSVNSNVEVDSDEVADAAVKMDINKDASLLFAPPELKTSENYTTIPDLNAKSIPKENSSAEQLPMDLKFYDLQVDYAQLLSYEDCKLRASDFQRMALDLHLQNDINLEAHDAAVDALLLSAECYVNPFLMWSSAKASKTYNKLKLHEHNVPKKLAVLELKKVFGKNSCNSEIVAQLEKKRDKVFIQILLQAAQMEKSYHSKESDRQQIVNLSDYNDESADAITLVRRHQEILCNFVIKQLQKRRQSMHETLIQSLVFLLHSATKLYCAPESVVDIILGSVEDLNKILVSMFQQHKEGSLLLTPDTLYRVQRRWELLQSIIIVSSGGGRRLNSRKSFHGLQYGNLVPPLAWLQKIPAFFSSPFPLVRYLGWMAVSRNANLYLEERLFLATDLSQLTHLLSIYTDDLAMVSESIDKHPLKSQQAEVTQEKEQKDPQERGKDLAFAVIYPDVNFFFPNMHKEFRAFGETILRAVALQLKSVASTAVPEILCWLSELCTSPFHLKVDNVTSKGNYLLSKGCHAKNARAVILFVLEAIVTRHMDAIVPEIPRVLQLVESICRRPYSDVLFLHSVLALLKPIIVYSLHLVTEEEKLLNDDSPCNYESLCFDELFAHVKTKTEADGETESVRVALVIFVLTSFVQDLSFVRKRDLMLSSLQWVDFAATEPTTSYHDYLCAFDQLFEGCKMLLVENLRSLGLIPIPQSGTVFTISFGDKSDPLSLFPDNFCFSNSTGVTDKAVTDKSRKSCQAIMPEEIIEFSSQLESLVLKLNLSVERCWKLHHQLSRKLAISSAQCLTYSRYLSGVHNHPSMMVSDNETAVQTDEDLSLISWNLSLESLAKDANSILENGCWEVASMFIDCLLRVPTLGGLDKVVVLVCSAIKHIMNFAPRITWRLQTDRWLTSLISKGILGNDCGTSLINLLSEMLSHPEPEQRLIALRHLSQLMGLDVNVGDLVLKSLSFNKFANNNRVLSVSDSVITCLVSSTWEQLTVMASSETSLPLRTIVMALLVQYIPYVEHHKLQAFLATADTLLLGFNISACRMAEGLLMKLLLSLIAGICLYSPAEEISVIPENVWRYVESIAMSKAGTLGDIEKRICQALCKFRAEGNDAKEAMKEVLLTCPEERFDPKFGSTRDTIFEVLSNLSTVQAYFDVFDDEVDQKTRELEEAELEMEIIQNEHESYADSDAHNKDADQDRLQQIKDSIHSVEKSRIREEIIARRQKKVLLTRTRQKHLEEAALREAQLLQELDSQRILESEREVERQQTLELERAKTNELRYNLSLEKEKHAQRELQRELEHLDSGVRGSRREFSSVHSRSRDRHKDKDGLKSGGDSSSRASTSVVQPELSINNSSTITSMPTVVLSGQRTLSGQLPTIMQTRDQVDEYEENIDSGDTGSTGDPELGTAFDGQVGGFGSSQRHSSRGVKSRQQAAERRERDGRREGKWERKH
ncbi:hypothetical protein V2J09_017417 [Rumex salicifolius]